MSSDSTNHILNQTLLFNNSLFLQIQNLKPVLNFNRLQTFILKHKE
jgi:hypothetical protein